MRRALLLLAIVVALACVPTVAAAPTQLTLELPEGPIEAPGNVPVTIHLKGSQFMCHEARELTVQLASNATGDVKALFERTTVTLPVPAHSYFIDEYAAEATVNLSVRAVSDGSVELTATFSADTGPCFVPGGFDPATVTITRDVVARQGTTPTPPLDNGTSTPPANETNATTPPTPRNSGVVTDPSRCAPDRACGYIGEYDTPQESSGKDAPGVAPVALVGAVAAVALLARARRR